MQSLNLMKLSIRYAKFIRRYHLCLKFVLNRVFTAVVPKHRPPDLIDKRYGFDKKLFKRIYDSFYYPVFEKEFFFYIHFRNIIKEIRNIL